MEYKVALTVKDRYGNIKEIDGGIINIDLTDNTLEKIEESLPFRDYLKKSEINKELGHFATDAEVESAIKEAAKTAEAVKYAGFKFEDIISEEGE